MTKRDIIRRGAALGLDYGLTHSCYDPGPAGPCGRCDSCVLRANGFAEAGLARSAHCADDRSHLLHRAVVPLVRGDRDQTRRARRPTGGGAQSHGVLSDVRRTALRHRPSRVGRRRRDHRRGRRHRPCRERPDAAGDAACAARSTGRAASITCSSTPGSTCCPRPSIGSSRTARRASTWAPSLDDRPDAGSDSGRCRTRRGRSQPRRVGGPRGLHPLCLRRGGRAAAAAQGTGARGNASAGRDQRLRSVGLRRDARRPHRRDRRDRASPTAERFRGGSRLTFVCGGRALRTLRGIATPSPGAVRVLSVLPHELPGRSSVRSSKRRISARR